jgi:hypothetical protein
VSFLDAELKKRVEELWITAYQEAQEDRPLIIEEAV